MIITCPNCQTRYKVANDAVAATGRQVQCASCDTAWLATPSFPKPASSDFDPEPDNDELAFRADRDALFSAADESLLDAAFDREAGSGEDTATEAPGPDLAHRPASAFVPHDAGAAHARTQAVAKRRNAMMSKLPLARFRRAARVILILIFVLMIGLVLTYRTEIVRAFPETDAIYRAIGLGTNVVGLEFIDVKTLRTTRDGNGVILVTAKISNITNRVAFVPGVLVSLIDGNGRVIYEWSVNPATSNILPGDLLGIDTQLTAPPEGVERVRLSFVEGRNRVDAGQ